MAIKTEHKLASPGFVLMSIRKLPHSLHSQSLIFYQGTAGILSWKELGQDSAGISSKFKFLWGTKAAMNDGRWVTFPSTPKSLKLLFPPRELNQHNQI